MSDRRASCIIFRFSEDRISIIGARGTARRRPSCHTLSPRAIGRARPDRTDTQSANDPRAQPSCVGSGVSRIASEVRLKSDATYELHASRP